MSSKKNKGKRCQKAEPPFDLYKCSEKASFQEGFGSVTRLLEGRKNVLVLAGAGVSVSCGIPDFRSKDSGLYSTLDVGELGLSCPEDLFDWDVFSENPEPFFKFAKSIYFPLGKDVPLKPSCSHKFLALLERKGMLRRVYTQNMDGLEEIAGVSPKKMVYAHGSLQWATCCQCKRKVPASEIRSDVLQGTVPRCQGPRRHKYNAPLLRLDSARLCSTRKRSRPVQEQLQDDSVTCGGVLKPDVTFFGEALRDNVRRSLESDRSKADALIVVGTSLSVAPMSKVIQYLPPNIPRILINRTLVRPPWRLYEDDSDDEVEKEFRNDYVFDACLLGFCDDVTRALVKLFDESETNGEDGKLLATLSDTDEFYDASEWQSVGVPHERVFLFPGAMVGEESDLEYREIAHCDGCTNEIVGGIHKCSQCFDFDLCGKCFPALSKTHAKGLHTFTIEPSHALAASTTD